MGQESCGVTDTFLLARFSRTVCSNITNCCILHHTFLRLARGNDIFFFFDRYIYIWNGWTSTRRECHFSSPSGESPSITAVTLSPPRQSHDPFSVGPPGHLVLSLFSSPLLCPLFISFFLEGRANSTRIVCYLKREKLRSSRISIDYCVCVVCEKKVLEGEALRGGDRLEISLVAHHLNSKTRISLSMPMDLIVCLALRAGVVNLPLNLREYARFLHNCTSVPIPFLKFYLVKFREFETSPPRWRTKKQMSHKTVRRG